MVGLLTGSDSNWDLKLVIALATILCHIYAIWRTDKGSFAFRLFPVLVPCKGVCVCGEMSHDVDDETSSLKNCSLILGWHIFSL